MEEELKPVDTLTPYQAGKIIRSNAEFIRAGLRAGRPEFLQFGSAVPPKKPGGRWTYKIIKSKFLKYADVLQGREVNTSENCK
jgi:hypothetical protein